MNQLALIRDGKFIPSEYQLECIKSINKQVIINWWCRNSGKTTLNIKLAHDYLLYPNSKIIIIPFSLSDGKNFIYTLRETFNENEISEITSSKISLINGSSIISKTIGITKEDLLCDLIIVDEFEWQKYYQIQNICDYIFEIKNPSLLEKIKRWIKNSKIPKMRVIFSSSRNTAKNYKFIKTHKLNPKVIRANIESTKLDKSVLLSIYSKDEFKKKYDSYK